MLVKLVFFCCIYQRDDREGSTGSSSPMLGQEDDEEEDVPKVDLEEDIPLVKSGFSVPPAYPPIQVIYMSHCLNGIATCTCT